MRRFSFAMTGALLCISQGLLWGAGAEQLKWGELGSRVGHNKVSMALPGGVYIEGKVVEVEPSGLRLKISRTSDRAVQPKGEHLIPRQSVSVLHITEYRKLGRLLGTLGAAAAAAGDRGGQLSGSLRRTRDHRGSGGCSGREQPAPRSADIS